MYQPAQKNRAPWYTTRSNRAPPRFAGFSIIEVEVALVLFGIALAGLAPCLVMYTKHLRNLQQRLTPQSAYYLAPSIDSWTRKLGAAATVMTQDPGPTPAQPATGLPANVVTINSIQKSLSSQEVTATINVQAAP